MNDPIVDTESSSKCYTKSFGRGWTMNDPIVDTESSLPTLIIIHFYKLNDERSDCGYWKFDRVSVVDRIQ